MEGLVGEIPACFAQIFEWFNEKAARYAYVGCAPGAEAICIGQWRVVPAAAEPIKDAMPSVSIVLKASASAALSVGNASSHTFQLPNSSTISSNQPPSP